MFSFRDNLVQVTPVGGQYGGQGFRLLSGNKIGLDPGAKAKQVPGFSEIPFDIVRQAAEPKITLEGMDAVEIDAVRNWVGGIGGSRYTISIVASRPGAPLFAIKVFQCEWSGGGGWNVDDAGSIDKIESLAKDIHFNGKSIFARRHPR
jgi:hypothetical protein